MTMRILHVDSGREWRGGQRQVLLLARAQRGQNMEPLVVAPPDSPLLKRLRGGGLAAAAVRMRGEWDLAAARRLRRIIRTWRPDVVHAHDARAHTIALAALVGMADLPLVVTRRVSFTPRGRLKYGPRVARFIAISRAVRDALVRGGVSPARIDMVHSGVPAPVVEAARDWRAECGWPQDAVICGVVGAMTTEKGIDVLEEIARRLTSDARQRARLVLLGGSASGPVTLGGVPAFRAGFVDAIHDAMAGLDLLLHPSSAEGLGTAVIDSMALGVPPIAFTVGGLPELIVPGRTGVLVPLGDLDAFAENASRLIADSAARAVLARNGPARAAEFPVERMVAGASATYATVRGSRAAAVASA